MRLLFEVGKGLEHGPELGRAQAFVKMLREAFQVVVGRIHMPEELSPRLLADIPSAHRDRLDPSLAASLGHVDRILQEDHRIIADPHQLGSEVRRLLALAPRPVTSVRPKAIIVPHAAYLYSGQVAATAFAALARSVETIERIVLIGPA